VGMFSVSYLLEDAAFMFARGGDVVS